MRTVMTPTQEAFNEALSSAKRESLKSFGNDIVLVEKFIERPRHVEVQVFADTMGGTVSLWERDCSVQRRNQKIIEEVRVSSSIWDFISMSLQAPAPGLTPEIRADLSTKAIAAAQAVHYVGAGTVEFIFDNDTQKFYFMEMYDDADLFSLFYVQHIYRNTRLQVEHPVTEMITGLDLVEWQLEVAAGNPLRLSQAEIPLVGHAFEARIYAENPRNNFLPDSGSLLYLSIPEPTTIFATPFPSVQAKPSSPQLGPLSPSGHVIDITPSLRIEQGFTQGAQIGVFYDPMIAKVVVHGRDRTEALRILRKALEDYHVVGVSTNVEFLRTLAGNEAFIAEEVETNFINVGASIPSLERYSCIDFQKHFHELFPEIGEPKPELLAKAALYVALRDRSLPSESSSSPWTSLSSRRFGGDVHECLITFQTETSENPMTVRVSPAPARTGHYDVAVTVANESATYKSVPAQLNSSTSISTTIDSVLTKTTVVSQKPPSGVPASRSPNTVERLHLFSNGTKTTLVLPSPNWLVSLGTDVLRNAAKGSLRAPMPSLVVEVKVKVGDMVEKGQAIVVLESMKTETVLRASEKGIVKTIGCKNGEMVEEGRELVEIEAEEM